MPAQTVWITGASSGIGEALALQYAQDGAHLILSARRENELERVAGKVGAPGRDPGGKASKQSMSKRATL